MTTATKTLFFAIAALVAAFVFFGVRERLHIKKSPYIDMPEDPPAAGDLLSVERVTPDSVIIGYANPQGMQLIHGR